jgi:hypothetical protein
MTAPATAIRRPLAARMSTILVCGPPTILFSATAPPASRWRPHALRLVGPTPVAPVPYPVVPVVPYPVPPPTPFPMVPAPALRLPNAILAQARLKNLTTKTHFPHTSFPHKPRTCSRPKTPQRQGRFTDNYKSSWREDLTSVTLLVQSEEWRQQNLCTLVGKCIKEELQPTNFLPFSPGVTW